MIVLERFYHILSVTWIRRSEEDSFVLHHLHRWVWITCCLTAERWSGRRTSHTRVIPTPPRSTETRWRSSAPSRGRWSSASSPRSASWSGSGSHKRSRFRRKPQDLLRKQEDEALISTLTSHRILPLTLTSPGGLRLFLFKRSFQKSLWFRSFQTFFPPQTQESCISAGLSCRLQKG